MDLIFKNVTKYSKEVYREFLRFHTEKNYKKYLIYALAILMGLVYIITFNAVRQKWTIIIEIIVLTIIAVCYMIFSQKKIIKDEMKSSKIKNEEIFEFEFFNEYIVIKNNGRKEKFEYKKICKIYETKTFFYLYINKNDAFLLSKDGFIEGNINNFKGFITNKK